MGWNAYFVNQKTLCCQFCPTDEKMKEIYTVGDILSVTNAKVDKNIQEFKISMKRHKSKIIIWSIAWVSASVKFEFKWKYFKILAVLRMS